VVTQDSQSLALGLALTLLRSSFHKIKLDSIILEFTISKA